MSLEIKQDSQYQGKNWWKWSVWIEGPTDELNQIENVTYLLHPSFANPVRTVADLASKFKLSSQGWGIFTIRIKVLKKDGSTESHAVELELSYPNDLDERALRTNKRPTVAALEEYALENAYIEDAEGQKSDTTVSKVRTKIRELVNEYEAVRRTMPSGYPRTQKMEKIASQMRSLARPAVPLLKDLVESPSAGERLAAVSILEEIPNPEYLSWLADRIKTEKPFIGYHASCALRMAARTLRSSHANEVRNAIARAQANLNSRD
jgi:transcription initiation factor IIF auxiliary subunit